MSNEGDGDMKKISLLSLPFLFFFVSGCLTSTPFQSARVVEPDQQAASVSLQRSVDYDQDNDYAWYMMEYAGRFPVAKGRMDFSVGGAILALEDEDGLGGVGALFGLGTKIELIPNILAIDIPARFMFAGVATLYTTHLYPRAILSLPVSELVEINFSHTRYVFFEETYVSPYAFSAGLAIGRVGGNIVRPEIGILVFPEGHNVLQFGIGFTPEAPVAAVNQKGKDETPY